MRDQRRGQALARAVAGGGGHHHDGIIGKGGKAHIGSICSELMWAVEAGNQAG
jgi:hypothetical protein